MTAVFYNLFGLWEVLWAQVWKPLSNILRAEHGKVDTVSALAAAGEFSSHHVI